MKEYDFINNTKESFAKKYNISSKIVSNYLKEFNIKCKKSGVTVSRNRDNFGKFKYGLSSQNNNSFSERNIFKSSVYKTEDSISSDNKPIRSLREYCKNIINILAHK